MRAMPLTRMRMTSMRAMAGGARMRMSSNAHSTVYGQSETVQFTVEQKAKCTMKDLGERVPIPAVNKFNPPPRLLCGPGPGNAHAANRPCPTAAPKLDVCTYTCRFKNTSNNGCSSSTRSMTTSK